MHAREPSLAQLALRFVSKFRYYLSCSFSWCITQGPLTSNFPEAPDRERERRRKKGQRTTLRVATMNEVIVLNEGYSRYEDTPEQEPSAVMLANCTCTLIKGRDCNVIVDTMTPWDGDLLLKRLQEHQLHPDDIDYVVSTHGHSDHLGNNNLFLGAKRHIVGTNISHRNRYYVHDFDNAPFRLTDDIEIQATPGHTMSCVTVLVADSAPEEAGGGRTAIVGDLFERGEDIENERLWIEAGSEDPRAQRHHRARIAELADWIIPGHGAAFRVDASIRQSLRRQADSATSAPVTGS